MADQCVVEVTGTVFTLSSFDGVVAFTGAAGSEGGTDAVKGEILLGPSDV